MVVDGSGNGLGYEQIPNILKMMLIVTDDIHNDDVFMILKKKIMERGFTDSDFKWWHQILWPIRIFYGLKDHVNGNWWWQ